MANFGNIIARKLKLFLVLKIKTTISAEELDVSEKYVIKCRKCGYKVKYALRPRNAERYCPICGSKKLTCFEKTDEGKIKLWKRSRK